MAYEIQTRFSPSLRRWAEGKLGVRLPESYVALLSKRNGGKLRMNAFKLDRRPKGPDSELTIYKFDRIAGVDRSHDESITALTELAKEWGVPAGLVPIDGDGHWWLCMDYRRCGPAGEPSLTHFDTELDYEYPVARSFQDLLAGLVFHCDEYVFAIDDPQLPGERLHEQLVALGCKGKYPPDATKADRTKPPRQWDWPEYAGLQHSPALFVYENGMADPWTLARPAKHPLLLVAVSRKDQQRCVLRLVQAFGDSLPLIHQPTDRPAIRGLPRYPRFQPAAKSRRSQPPVSTEIQQTELNAAVLQRDMPRVRALLKAGAKPDKPPIPKGATALGIAASYGLTAIFKLLLKHARRPPDRGLLAGAIGNGHLGVVKLLVDQGLRPNEEDLTRAVTYRHEPLVRYLLSLGVRPAPKAVRRAAGIVEPSLVDAPRGVHRPILRMLKKAGAAAPDAEVRRIFDTL
jgi:hypothetical protein